MEESLLEHSALSFISESVNTLIGNSEHAALTSQITGLNEHIMVQSAPLVG